VFAASKFKTPKVKFQELVLPSKRFAVYIYSDERGSRFQRNMVIYLCSALPLVSGDIKLLVERLPYHQVY